MIKKGDRKVSYIDEEKFIEKLDKQVIKENRKSRNNLIQHALRVYFKK
jgi:metal-responsive CopG/Arc/MetJ family transcriptional regulator